MLVLSRRTHEKIFFPGIAASVEVVSVKPGVVRLGIEAPPEVRVLREELAGVDLAPPEPGRVEGSPPKLTHQLRNRLNSSSIGLALLRQQLQMGMAQGATATLDRLDHELTAMREQVEQLSRRPAPAARRRKALLVEDDQNECELMAGFLRLAGLDVATAGDGSDALDYLRTQGRPDVVLLDMVLPRCDGPTTVRAIRRDPAYAGLKIIALSGCTPDQLDLRDEAGRVDRWYRKPLNPEAFLRDLNRELDAIP